MQFLHKEFEDAFDVLEHLSQYHIKHLEHLIDNLLLLQIPQPDWLAIFRTNLPCHHYNYNIIF